MANRPVLGSGPIDISDANFGRQLSIPLTSLYFDDQGTIKADQWPEYGSGTAQFKKNVDGWLSYLSKQSLLSPGKAPTAKPAFQIGARDPGSTGNFITVEFRNVVPDTKVPGNTTADVTVTETDTYTLLTPDTLEKVIGKSSGGGSKPGLVFLATATPILPAAGGGDLKSAGVGKPFIFDFAGAFTVQSKHDEADAALTNVKISAIDPVAKTFTLIATWKKTAPAVKLSDLGTTFGYELTVTPPKGVFSDPPAAGTVTLTGGSDPISVSAVKAQATVVS